jgi:hypothetical protein
MIMRHRLHRRTLQRVAGGASINSLPTGAEKEPRLLSMASGGHRIQAEADIMGDNTLDLTEIRRVWSARCVAARTILARIDFRGLSRPARDPDERAWLDSRGEAVLVEDPSAGRAARAYYERKYQRPKG